MYECFHCGHRAVIWDSDFEFADYGEEGEGIIVIEHDIQRAEKAARERGDE